MQNFVKTILSAVKTWTQGKIKESITASTADWNQNDKSADNYVKNRTHWEEKDGTIHKLDSKYLDLPTNLATVNEVNKKMDAYDPVGTGAFSMNRKENTDIGYHSHAEGSYATASGFGSHAEGGNTTASGSYSHAEGFETIASSSYSHTEGFRTNTDANGSINLATISSSTTGSAYSHAEGHGSCAKGYISHAEGNGTTASGRVSHTEGHYTKASGDMSHAEGYSTLASGEYAHAEGSKNVASGIGSHAEGYSDNLGVYARNTASGNSSHAEGSGTTASGHISHSEGCNTIAASTCQHVQGESNIVDEEHKYAHIVGNGDINSGIRSNAHTLDWEGNAWYQGDVYVGSTSGTNKDSGSKKLATEEYVNTSIANKVTVPQNAVAGDLLTYDGTNWVRISKADLIAEIIAALPNAEEASF